jgi:hypothetical protein
MWERRSYEKRHDRLGTAIAAPLPNCMQSFRRWAVCMSACRDKFSDNLQVLCVSGLKSRVLVDYKTTVIGVRKSDIDISGPVSPLLLPGA